MSTFDENTEHEDRPEFDDNGEPIIYIEQDVIPDEFASEYDGVIDLDVQDDSFYETVWGGDASSVATLAADDSTTGEEVTDPLEVEVEQDASDTTENDGILEQAEENYNNAVDILINILTQALAQGEITEEMNASILDAQGTKTKNEQIIKEICNVQEDNSILKQLADIKANMVAANVDDIIDILTEGGTKPWLYKDSDNNVLVDSQSIPELTVLVNKLNLIATGGDEASEIQLTPEFIKLVSSNINIKAENITLEGLVTANENFKILEDGSMMAKNGYFTGQIFVGDGSVIGDGALSDTIRNGANNGTLAIQKLNVVDADIKNLKANKADITDLHATNAEIDNLKANKADIEYLDANYATIQQLNAANANISNLQANKANITDLNATNANISNLNATVGNIQTLVNGNLTSDNIQSMAITGDKFTVANGFIKNAMIDSINANKINAGTINTNNVNIQSSDGSMVINGSTQQFKDKNNKVRIQIGKDVQGNFTFALFSQDGKGVLIDETGIKSGAVPDGLIVNDMVADNANISGGKLDISSVISSINNNENTLNASKIKFDETEQTLEVAFNQLKTKVETIADVTIDGDLSSVIEQVTTNTTNIQIAQGQINSLISNTTITKEDGTVVQMKDEFNSVKDTVNSHTQTINYHESTLNDVTAKQTKFEQSLDGFKTTVSNTYATKSDLSTTNNNVSSVIAKQSELEQSIDGFKTTVSNTYQTKDDMNNYSTTQQMISAINQRANEITSTVSETYATKDEIGSITDNIGDYMVNISKSTILLTSDLNGNIIN